MIVNCIKHEPKEYINNDLIYLMMERNKIKETDIHTDRYR